MKVLIASMLAAAWMISLMGCDSKAQPSASPMLRYQVDSERQRSWWLTRDGVILHSASAAPKAVPLPGWLWAGDPHCPPDLALGPKGEAVVTSNAISTVWRIDPATLAVTVHDLRLDADTDKDVGFAAVVYAPEQKVFLAYSEVQRSVWKIDAELQTASKVGRADFTRTRAQRFGSLHAPCADLANRLMVNH